MTRIAVIGAGLAGLTAARALAAEGHDVALFDKGRGPGGRLSTRRAEGFVFDHGAQFFTARDPGFQALTAEWRAAGVAAAWTPQGAAPVSETCWAGQGGMNAPIKHMAQAFQVSWGVEIASAQWDGRVWTLADKAGARITTAGGLVVAIPAPQARTFAQEDHVLLDRLSAIVMAPCWALLAGFDDPAPGADTLMEPAAGPLALAALTSSKPGHDASKAAWVFHATPAWSMENLELSADAVKECLWQEAARLTGRTEAPSYLAAHRWRFAKAAPAAGPAALLHAARPLAFCGDWCLGPRIENAFLSGQAAARLLMTRLGG